MIPSTAHFIWFGTELPWVHALAIRTAALRGGFDRVVLHHADPLDSTRWWPWLNETRGFEARTLDPAAVLGACPDGDRLQALFAKLSQPAARANMVRAGILYSEGGVYLDLDTVTLKSLDALRASSGVFCGEEHIVFPSWVKQSRSPAIKGRAYLQTALRDLLRRAPRGYLGFDRIADWYPRAVNNAVFGAAPGHPFVATLLTNMLALPPSQQLVRFALGTHLLQQTVADWDNHVEPAHGPLVVHRPAVFYPLGPEISEHWFRATRSPDLSRVAGAETRIVHWYASVRTKALVPRITPDYVRAHRSSQLFSAMVAPLLDET